MDIKKTEEKLHKLNDEDLETLYDMVLSEKDTRMTFMSNKSHKAHDQSQALQNFFAQAWIH